MNERIGSARVLPPRMSSARLKYNNPNDRKCNDNNNDDVKAKKGFQQTSTYTSSPPSQSSFNNINTKANTYVSSLNIPSITQLNPTTVVQDLNPYSPYSYRSIRAGVPHRLPLPNLYTPSSSNDSNGGINSKLPKRLPIVFTNSGPAVPKPMKPPQNAIADLKLLSETLRRANRPIGLIMCYFSQAIYYENTEAYIQALNCLIKAKKVVDSVGIGEESKPMILKENEDNFIQQDIPMHVPLVLYLKSSIALCYYMLGKVQEAEAEYISMRALIEAGTLTEFCIRQGTCYILEFSREESTDDTIRRMNSLILTSISNGEALCSVMMGRGEEAIRTIHKGIQYSEEARDIDSSKAMKTCLDLFQGKFDTHSSIGDYIDIANDGFKYSHGIVSEDKPRSKPNTELKKLDQVKTDEAISFLLLSGDLLSKRKEYDQSEQILHKAYLKSMAAQNQEKMLDASCHLGISRGTSKIEEAISKLVNEEDDIG